MNGLALLGFLLWLMPAPQDADAAKKTTLEGVVVRADSNEPLSGIRVTLTKAPKPPEPRTSQSILLDSQRAPAPTPSAATDAEGRFVFKDVDPGAYRVAVAANGYVRQEYGQKAFPGQGTTIDLTADAPIKDLKIRLTPTASIGGRVWDSAKQPVAVVPVHLMRFTYDASGRRQLQAVASTQTDDRGDYRIYHLTPGRYYLASGMLPGGQPARTFNGAAETYAVTYYPGVSEIGQAAAIEIKPGADMARDISMAPQILYRIRGKVLDSRLGQPPTSIIAGLTTSGAAGSYSYEIRGADLTYRSADGTFEIRGVLPGTHLLNVTWGDEVSLSGTALAALGIQAPTPGNRSGPAGLDPFNVVREGVAYATVNIGNTDVENVTLTLAPGGPVTGRLRLEGPDAAAAPNLKVQLKPSLNGLPANLPGLYPPRPGDVSADGAFSISNVRAGEYRVSVEGTPAGYYVKEARVGPNDALDRPFQFNSAGADQNVLEIVLGAGAASIGGTASNERLEGVSGAQIVLVPERQRDRLDLYKTAAADTGGHFQLLNIAPGDYKLWAFETLEPNAFFDPELLKQVDGRGKSIHLDEGSSGAADLRTVPAESPF